MTVVVLTLHLDDGSGLIETGLDAKLDYAIIESYVESGCRGYLRPFPDSFPERYVVAYQLNINPEVRFHDLQPNWPGAHKDNDRGGSPGGAGS